MLQKVEKLIKHGKHGKHSLYVDHFLTSYREKARVGNSHATVPLNIFSSRFSAQKNGRLNSGSGERNGSPWPPWRLPTACDPKYTDPRVLLHSRYAHGLIFNLLYKAVHQEVSSENITSLTLFLLELALSLPQTDFSGKVRKHGSEAQEYRIMYLLGIKCAYLL